LSGTEPSLLLHPLDFLGLKDVPELAFFPAMKLDAARKLTLLDRAFRVLSANHTVLPLGEHARKLQADLAVMVYSPARLRI